MTQPTIDGFVRALRPHASRRGAVRAVGALGLAGLLGRGGAQAKRKKKKCPKGPKPRKGICAGHVYCAEYPPFSCNKPDGLPCFCHVRAEPGHIGDTLCTSAIQTLVAECSACPAEQMCVLMGGLCGLSGFACVTTCPDPL